MDDFRPNPDALLKAAQMSEGSGRGRLKIFFGACAGVGKTYAMLSAAQEKKEDGVDVLVGVAVTHGRAETEELLQGLPTLPLLKSEHRGITIEEFDLDGALKANPSLILIDELAHTNAAISRHPKRWMDVMELLETGIDVYTTLNVQHLESLNDIVAGTTGIRVRETVPDSVFDAADDITLVDIPSDDLLERMREGKVYITELGKKRAAAHFFRRENLIALRELALRRTAERVDAQQDSYARYAHSKIADKIAVCIGPGDLSLKLIRAAKRLAGGLKSPWIGLYVENARHHRLNQQGQFALERNLRLAEQLGGKTEILHGDNAAAAIMEYARTRGVTKIIVGKAYRSRWWDWLRGSLTSELIARSGPVDIHVVTGEDKVSVSHTTQEKYGSPYWHGYGFAVALCALATVIALPFKGDFASENFVMLYLVGIILTAARYGRRASILASIISFCSYNFFFTEPYYSFDVKDYNDLITLSLLLITGLISGAQTSWLRAQSRFFRRRERNTSSLYAMSRELASARGRNAIVEIIRKHLEDTFGVIATVWLPDKEDLVVLVSPTGLESELREERAAWWAQERKQPSGMGTSTLTGARGYYIPMEGSENVVGVLGFIPKETGQQFTAEERALFETFGALAASALERVAAADRVEQHKVEAESERLRNTLLSSVSHDLRTPLASIKGVISSLMMEEMDLNPETKKDLLHSAYTEVARLERIVSNLLDVTLLESGRLTLKKDFYFLPELIGSAIKQVEPQLGSHKIQTQISKDLPAIEVDGILIEQVLVNLLENAVKYTPGNTTITVLAKRSSNNKIQVQIEDDGPGIPKGQEERIFDKFTALPQEGKQGSGLGLAICRGILNAHGGTIYAANRKTGGAVFTFSLPAATLPEEQKGEDA